MTHRQITTLVSTALLLLLAAPNPAAAQTPVEGCPSDATLIAMTDRFLAGRQCFPKFMNRRP